MDLEFARFVGEALAIGLLVGVERYKSRRADEKGSAGPRTFAVIGLLGAVCALLDVTAFTLVTLVSLLAFLAIGYYRGSKKSVGMTTELAAVLTFWLGYLVRTHEVLTIGAAIVLVILLSSKAALHRFVKGAVSEVEFYDTLKFLAVVFVVFPLLPDRYVGPYELLNPTQIWMLVIIVSTISYAGYVLIRALGGKRGLQVSAVVGGLVSTMAVTMSLAQRARENADASRAFGVTAVTANAVMFPRLLALVAVVDLQLAQYIAIPLLGMFASGMAGAWVLGRTGKVWDELPPVSLLVRNPYSFWPALKFALLFVVVFAVTKLATASFGEGGVHVVSALAGLADVSAIALSLADMTLHDSVTTHTACAAILIAATVNTVMKLIVAHTNGTRVFTFWLGGGLVTMLVVGWSLFAVISLM